MKNYNNFPGSLICDNGYICSSYDLDKDRTKPMGISLLKDPRIFNYALSKFEIDIKKIKNINIINGMGVTLGDSIVGISCLHAMKKMNEELDIHIIRPKSAPAMVEDLYKLLSDNILKSIKYMPQPLERLEDGITIDMGNQIYRKLFDSIEMHDYFFESMGLGFIKNSEFKKNQFLKEIAIESNFNFDGNYVLFAPYASTPVRSIPDNHHESFIKHLSKRHEKQVLGFSKLVTPGYKYIGDLVRTTSDFIKSIAFCDFLLTVDSAALHIAAGFDKPCQSIFTTIRPELRTKYYTNCEPIYIGNNEIDYIHQTDNPMIIRKIRKAFDEYF